MIYDTVAVAAQGVRLWKSAIESSNCVGHIHSIFLCFAFRQNRVCIMIKMQQWRRRFVAGILHLNVLRNTEIFDFVLFREVIIPRFLRIVSPPLIVFSRKALNEWFYCSMFPHPKIMLQPCKLYRRFYMLKCIYRTCFLYPILSFPLKMKFYIGANKTSVATLT